VHDAGACMQGRSGRRPPAASAAGGSRGRCGKGWGSELSSLGGAHRNKVGGRASVQPQGCWNHSSLTQNLGDCSPQTRKDARAAAGAGFMVLAVENVPPGMMMKCHAARARCSCKYIACCGCERLQGGQQAADDPSPTPAQLLSAKSGERTGWDLLLYQGSRNRGQARAQLGAAGVATRRAAATCRPQSSPSSLSRAVGIKRTARKRSAATLHLPCPCLQGGCGSRCSFWTRDPCCSPHSSKHCFRHCSFPAHTRCQPACCTARP